MGGCSGGLTWLAYRTFGGLLAFDCYLFVTFVDVHFSGHFFQARHAQDSCWQLFLGSGQFLLCEEASDVVMSF